MRNIMVFIVDLEWYRRRNRVVGNVELGMNIYLFLSYCGVCSVLISGCASTEPPQPQYHSPVPLAEAARHRQSPVPLVEAARHPVRSDADGKVMWNNEGELKTLVAAGVDVNQQDKAGRTALMEAAFVNFTSASKGCQA